MTRDRQSNNRLASAEGEEADRLTFIAGSMIGKFTVNADMASGGTMDGGDGGGHLYWVYVCAHSKGIPHFHVFDKGGDPYRRRRKGGIHACIEIRRNRYCKHGRHLAELDKAAREALDRFLREVRTAGKHCCNVGTTNYFHTVAEWGENNASPGTPRWLDPMMAQPDYRTIKGMQDGEPSQS